MILMFLKYTFAGILPLLSYFGVGGLIVLACVGIYAFTPALLLTWFPNIKKVLIWVATITVAAMVFTTIGVTLGERRIQAQWNQASANAIEMGKQARAGAVRDVARKPHRWLSNKPDGFNRDGK